MSTRTDYFFMSTHAQVAQMRARADALALEEVMRQEEEAAKLAQEALRRSKQVRQLLVY